MTPEDFDFVAGMLKQRSGLVLTKDKMYLLESRLTPVARQRGMATMADLVKALRSNPSEALLEAVTEAMTTNESFFFRDQKPFDQFRDIVMPYLLETRASAKAFRVWSAAASTGQESYSICMLLKEMSNKLNGWKTDIFGTDLSKDVLHRAREGLYTQFEVQRGLPITLLMKYFTQTGEHWQIKPEIRQMVKYKEFNLLHDMSSFGRFDVVFCRNVLIYFDQETKSDILERIARQMTPDGFLYLGGAETVLGICDKFKPIQGQRGLYSLSSNFVPAAGSKVAAAG